MLTTLAMSLSGLIVATSLLLWAFARRQESERAIQAIFAFLAINYAVFFWSLTGSSHITAIVTILLGASEGPLLLWLVRSKTHDQVAAPHWSHFLPAVILGSLVSTLPAGFIDLPYILVSVSRLTYAAVAGYALWKVHNSRSEIFWLAWVSLLVGAAIALSLLKLSSYVVYYMDQSWRAPDWLIFAKTIGISGVSLSLLWWALVRPEIYRGPAAANTKVPSSLEQDIHQKFHQLMQTDKLYLQTDLNLQKAAEYLALLPRELSEALNRTSGKGFKSLLRQYRIEHACGLLADPANCDSGVLEIALESGFATKSVFNTAFKTEVGQTPSGYRKAQLGQ